MALLYIGLSSFRAFLNPQRRGVSAVSFSVLRGLCSGEIMHPSSANTQDFLLQNIKSSTDAEHVLQIVGAHHTIMNSRHVMQALRCLFQLEKSGNCRMPKFQIVSNPDFIKLCKRLKSQARGISLNDSVEALKIISFMGVPTNSTIVQVLLQLVRHGVNDLSLHHIIFLEFMMKNFSRSPLVDALKIALPLVFEAQLSLKMNRDDATHLGELLQYASKKTVSESAFNLIVDTLYNVRDDIDVKIATSVVWSLHELKKSLPFSQELLVHCWHVLAEDIEQCSYAEVNGLLGLMVKKYSQKQQDFYHEHFADQCAKYVVSKDCGFEDGIWILKKLTRLGHVNISLIDYLGEKIIHNPQVIEECQLVVLLSLVSGIANSGYKPYGWDSIREAILRNRAMAEKEKPDFPWVKLALDFATLDIFCQDLIEHIFQEDFLKQLLSRENNLLDQLQLLLLFQAVVTLYPSYAGFLPSCDMFDLVMAHNGDHVQHFPLQAALEQGLGGASYVWTRLHTKLGHFIDHVVVMRKGGYPVALNQTAKTTSSKTFVEDLLIPPDSQIILVLCMPASCYASTCKRMRSVPALTLRTLESLGHSVVPLSLELWMNLPDYEKIPYLMHNIKMKCESVCNNEMSIVH